MACLNLLLSRSDLEKLPAGEWWIAMPGLMACMIVWPLTRFRQSSTARDMVVLNVYEIYFYVFCIWSYVLSLPSDKFLRAVGYGWGLHFFFMLGFIRILWMLRDPETQAYMDWPKLPLSGLLPPQEEPCPPNSTQKMWIGIAVLLSLAASYYLAVNGNPYARWTLGTLGVFWLFTHSHQIYQALIDVYARARQADELQTRLNQTEAAIGDLKKMLPADPEIQQAVRHIQNLQVEVRRELMRMLGSLDNSTKVAPAKPGKEDDDEDDLDVGDAHPPKDGGGGAKKGHLFVVK